MHVRPLFSKLATGECKSSPIFRGHRMSVISPRNGARSFFLLRADGRAREGSGSSALGHTREPKCRSPSVAEKRPSTVSLRPLRNPVARASAVAHFWSLAHARSITFGCSCMRDRSLLVARACAVAHFWSLAHA
eukprot:311292-Prorocentrum_minimum.AAC.2